MHSILILAAVAAASAYDALVVAQRPAVYLPLAHTSGVEPDRSGGGRDGAFLPAATRLAAARLPNGDTAAVFDGLKQYVEVPSSPALSIPAGGALTFEAWIRPDTLDFPRAEADGYVHWAGKGEPGAFEYALRMYSLHNGADRPNRISGYAFNLAGGLGSGSYFQDQVLPGAWLHVAVVFDAVAVRIYKNGVLRDTTPLTQFAVVPAPGGAPLRIGTRDRRSFFLGAIGKVALYRRALSAVELRAHVAAMMMR